MDFKHFRSFKKFDLFILDNTKIISVVQNKFYYFFHHWKSLWSVEWQYRNQIFSLVFIYRIKTMLICFKLNYYCPFTIIMSLSIIAFGVYISYFFSENCFWCSNNKKYVIVSTSWIVLWLWSFYFDNSTY
jgi:hypothetical protein